MAAKWPGAIDSMAQFSRPIQGVADGLPVRTWEPLRSHWSVQGHDRANDIYEFCHAMPSRWSEK